MMPASPGLPPRRRVCVWTCVCASVRARAGRAWAWVLGAAGRRHTCDPFPARRHLCNRCTYCKRV